MGDAARAHTVELIAGSGSPGQTSNLLKDRGGRGQRRGELRRPCAPVASAGAAGEARAAGPRPGEASAPRDLWDEPAWPPCGAALGPTAATPGDRLGHPLDRLRPPPGTA